VTSVACAKESPPCTTRFPTAATLRRPPFESSRERTVSRARDASRGADPVVSIVPERTRASAPVAPKRLCPDEEDAPPGAAICLLSKSAYFRLEEPALSVRIWSQDIAAVTKAVAQERLAVRRAAGLGSASEPRERSGRADRNRPGCRRHRWQARRDRIPGSSVGTPTPKIG
jgi:hypothetical protein